jgi:integrase/recombinase XerD
MTEKVKHSRTLPQYLPLNDVKVLLDAPYKTNIRDRLILRLMACGGLRASEVIALQRKNFLFEEDKFMVRNGKGAVDRLIPLTNRDLRETSLKYVEMFNLQSDDCLFDISRQSIYGLVRRYAQRAGIQQKVHPHMLRHSFAVYCIKSGMDIRTLQQIMGHKYITTTSVYLQVTGEDIIESSRNHPLPY